MLVAGSSTFIVCISAWRSSLVIVASLWSTVGSNASVSMVAESSRGAPADLKIIDFAPAMPQRAPANQLII